MNRDFIRNEAIRKMEAIEERFQGYVPPEVQQYYLLQYLIVNGIQSYVECHGLYPLDKSDCEEGKDICGFGALSFFEGDCVHYLSEVIDRPMGSSNKTGRSHHLTVYRS